MTTAEVNLLTAEVRTLMIGNRQVTRSVYQQLDEVEPEVIEPFGRVHCKNPGVVAVVGRHRVDGDLVRCWAQEHTPWASWAVEWRALPLIVLAGLR